MKKKPKTTKPKLQEQTEEDALLGKFSSSAGPTELSVTVSDCYGCSKTAVIIQLIHFLCSIWAAEIPPGHVGPCMPRCVKPGRLYEVCTRYLQGSHESEDRD